MFDDAIKNENYINYDEIPDRLVYKFPYGKYTVKVLEDTVAEKFEQKAVVLVFEIKDSEHKGKKIEKSFALWTSDKAKNDSAGQQLKDVRIALQCNGQTGDFLNKFMTVTSVEKINQDGTISAYPNVSYGIIS